MMQELLEPDTKSLERDGRWFHWALALVALYLIVGFAGWQRTLIGTEVWALYHAGQPLQEQMHAIRADLVHPPLMYLLERIWMRGFGQTDAAVKALALLINLPTFFLFTWLAHRITPHWRLASFFFLSVYLKIGSTPNLVRMYGLGLLLTVLAMVLWERWNEKPTNHRLIAWSCVALLLIYTHLFGALLLAGFWAANWLLGPRRWAFTAAAAIPALAFVPWLAYVYPIYHARGLTENVAWVPKQFSVSMGIFAYGLLGEFPIRYLPAQILLALVAGLIQLALLILALPMARRSWPPHRGLSGATRWFWAAGVLAYIPLASIILFSICVTPALHWRFVLGILPAYWLFIVLVCEWSGDRKRMLLRNVMFVWIVLNLGAGFARRDIPSAARQAAVVLATEQRASDLILCESSCNEIYWELTSHFGQRSRIESITDVKVSDRLSVVPQADLDAIASEQAKRIWVFGEQGRQNDKIVELIRRGGFAEQREVQLGNDAFLLFSRDSDVAAR